MTSKINSKRFSPEHFVIKLSNIKERLSKQHEKNDLTCTSAPLQD